MSEIKRTRNLIDGETNDEYDEGGVGNYSKYTMVDENGEEAKKKEGEEAEKKEVDEAEIEDIEDKQELEEVLYSFLVPVYFRRVRNDGKVKFGETTCIICKGADFADDNWMKLHDTECHSKSDEPIKYECLNENCLEVFDTRLERHLHSKKKYNLKFNINNLVKYGVTGNLLKRFYDQYHNCYKRMQEMSLKISNKIPAKGEYQRYSREDVEKAMRNRKKSILREQAKDKRDQAYYNAIYKVFDLACLDIIRTYGEIKFVKTVCNLCGEQFVTYYWHRLHLKEFHEEDTVELGCFHDFCDDKFDTLEERDIHCREVHKHKFDVSDFLMYGLDRKVYDDIAKDYYDNETAAMKLKKEEEDEQVEEITDKMNDLMKPRSVIMKEKNIKPY